MGREKSKESQDGSDARAWKGHQPVCTSLQEVCSSVAEDHQRRGEGPDLQAGKEGSDPFPDWCYPQGLPWCCSGPLHHWKQDSAHPEEQGHGPRAARGLLPPDQRQFPSGSILRGTGRTGMPSSGLFWLRAGSTAWPGTTSRPASCPPPGSTRAPPPPPWPPRPSTSVKGLCSTEKTKLAALRPLIFVFLESCLENHVICGECYQVPPNGTFKCQGRGKSTSS